MLNSIKRNSKHIVSLDNFNITNKPEIVGYQPLNCPHDKQMILRMPVMIDKGL